MATHCTDASDLNEVRIIPAHCTSADYHKNNYLPISEWHHLQIFTIILLRSMAEGVKMKYVRLGNSGLKVSSISIASKVCNSLTASSWMYVLRDRFLGEMGFE